MINKRYTSEKDLQIPLLSLVDIFFSAAGIFLILISIINLLQTRMKLPPPVPDAVLICSSSEPFRYFTPDHPRGIDIGATYELKAFLTRSLKVRNKSLFLLIAFDGQAFAKKNTVNRLIKQINRENLKIGQGGGMASHIETMLWPLASPHDVPEIIKSWIKKHEAQTG